MTALTRAHTPRVDVIIAVHTPQRPILRAVSSVLDHTSADVRVTVVVHNTELAPIAVHLTRYAADHRLRLAHFVDGVPSPAGPMNHGLSLATAEFTALLGSDDEFAPGAIDRWLELAERTGARAVLAGLRFSDGPRVPQPPVRPRNRLKRNPIADRLAYRSAPLGLIATGEFGHLRLIEAVQTGEDLAYSLAVWFSGKPIAFDATDDGYRIHRDGDDRVTEQPRPLRVEWVALTRVLETEFDAGGNLRGLVANRSAMLAIVVKLLRVQVLGSLAARGLHGQALDADDLATLRATRGLLLALAPGAERLLSRSELRLLRSAIDGRVFRDEAAAWGRKFTLSAVCTQSPTTFLHPQAALRYGIASVVQLRRR